MDGYDTSSAPTIEVRRPRPDTALVALSGEHDLSSAAELGETLSLALECCTHLIVDLSCAEFIDSSTINALVNAKKYADNRECRFNLILATTPIVERALEITGFLPGLNRVATIEQALAPLNRSDRA
jgi:anti-anti-sigma factor